MQGRLLLVVLGGLILGCHSWIADSTFESGPPQSVSSPTSPLPALQGQSQELNRFPPTAQETLYKPNQIPEAAKKSPQPTDPEDGMQGLMIRMHYAELLVKNHKEEQAREEFERFVRDAQEIRPLPLRQLIHGHSRLMELALQADDDYAEHLHRGIGLYYLACQCSDLAQSSGKLNVESLLCQSAGELSEARLQAPWQARPPWYLFQVWSRLDQAKPARKNLACAAALGSASYLSPAERRSLYLASTAHSLSLPFKR